MRIAQCLEYPLELRGGVSVVVESLATELKRQGHEIVLVSPDNSLNPEPFVETHIHWDPKARSIESARKLAQQLSAAGVDIAHFHAGGNYGWNNRVPLHSPTRYLRRIGIPAIWTSHRAETVLDGFCGPEKPLLFKFGLLPVAWLGKIDQLSSSRMEIAVSDDNLQKLRRWYWPLRSRFVRIYHSRLPAGDLENDEAKREPIILTVGHLAAVKGQPVLVEAFARIAQRLPDFKLQIAGHAGNDGTVERIQKLVKKHGLEKRVFLLGQHSEPHTLMRRAAIYVQPSLNEALGLALQEAMFAGCASIGSRAGGIPELIQHNQNGLLFERGNVQQLAQLLEELIADEPRRARLGLAASSSIRDRGFTAAEMVKRHLELYERALQR